MGKLVSDDNENLKYEVYLEERKILEKKKGSGFTTSQNVKWKM